MMRQKSIFILFILLLPILGIIHAQSDELAATLEVLSSGVEVQRVNTTNWIAVKLEAIVGVGDTIRTDKTGKARITFFSDGVDTELEENTEYRITRFEGKDASFNIGAEVVVGQTLQRIGRVLDSNSSYDITTPSMALAARGTEFTIRVNDAGRAATLVSKGVVKADAESATANVPPGYGIRRDAGKPLSEVVQATTFDQLDAALDGCSASVKVDGDFSLNVRQGADLTFPMVGTIAPNIIDRFFGKTTTNWYRIPFRGGYGWVESASAKLVDGCSGLRQFADKYGPEDVKLYQSLGNPIQPSDLQQAPESTPESTPSS
ncbi:MAG: FecR domain-containing protein [Anaerolineae bacterium]|nr:FecR domain-containing protein [Anaerolineae bacterium]